jgi:hypothetical protein
VLLTAALTLEDLRRVDEGKGGRRIKAKGLEHHINRPGFIFPACENEIGPLDPGGKYELYGSYMEE